MTPTLDRPINGYEQLYRKLEAENARLKSEQKGMVRADVLLRYGRLYHRKYMMFPFPFITTQLIASRAGRER